MNEKQLATLSITFFILMLFFIWQDSFWNNHCMDAVRNIEQPSTAVDVSVCVKAEVYAPFIILCFALGMAFLICSSLEGKRRG